MNNCAHYAIYNHYEKIYKQTNKQNPSRVDRVEKTPDILKARKYSSDRLFIFNFCSNINYTSYQATD